MNTCVLLRSESIDATPDPFTEFNFAKGLAKVKLGEFVDGSNNHYKPSIKHA